jgi:hypothetical protein
MNDIIDIAMPNLVLTCLFPLTLCFVDFFVDGEAELVTLCCSLKLVFTDPFWASSMFTGTGMSKLFNMDVHNFFPSNRTTLCSCQAVNPIISRKKI